MYYRNTDYECGNLKPLTERTEISLMPRESWEVLLDCSEDEQGQSAGEAQAPVPVVVRGSQPEKSTDLQVIIPPRGSMGRLRRGRGRGGSGGARGG